jgi:dTDP-4-amino-4,6-dideoxygalactose transaminase
MAEPEISVDWAYHPALHLQPVFRDIYGTEEGMLPRTEELLDRLLCLPCHPRMTEADTCRVADALKYAIAEDIEVSSLK